MDASNVNSDVDLHVETGNVSTTDGVILYYEIRRPQQSAPADHKIIMIMGAFATRKHFEEQAEAVVRHFAKTSTPFEVMTYDHRGIGKSAPAPPGKQTTKMLADDALALVNQVWGETTPVHIYGASMGGMVAQKMAPTLIQQNRLRSAYFAVTSRGRRGLGFLGPTFWRFVLPFGISSNRQKMVENVLTSSFIADETPTSVIEHYREKWLSHYDEWFIFSDREMCAIQADVANSHFLTDEEISVIIGSGVNVTVQVHNHDKIVWTSKQRELAKLLKAKKTVAFNYGHSVRSQKIVDAIIDHLKEQFE